MLRYFIVLNVIGFIYAQGGGYALDFDGSNDLVIVNDDASLTSTSAITISA